MAEAQEERPAIDIGVVPTTMEEAEALHVRNMEFLRQHYPVVHAKIANIRPQAELILLDDGQFDLDLRGKRLYEKGHRDEGAKQIDAALARPMRFSQVPPVPENFDNEASDFVTQILKRGTLEGLEFTLEPNIEQPYIALVLGVGLGGHLADLANRTDVHAMVLVEPHPEFFWHSTFTVDWEAFCLSMLDVAHAPEILISQSPETISDTCRSGVRMAIPVGAERIWVVRHYPNPILEEALEQMRQNRELFFTGLGFFEDETFMLRHTFRNLYRGKTRTLKSNPEKQRTIPVIIVGGGPSKDEHFEVIRKLSERAVLISCGGALDSLMNEGIKPDFHVLIERDNVWGEWLEETVSRFDLDGMHFIGSTTVDPRTTEPFDEKVLFFRRGLSPWPLFNIDEASLRFSDPEVVNGGIDFAVQSGFREFYFFGVDLGCKDPDYHHSRFSHAMHKQTMDKPLDMRVPGNFGGEILTHRNWFWVKDTIERNIRFFRQGRLYANCSDGAFIEGATPTRADKLELPELKKSKAEHIQELLSDHPRMDRAKFAHHWYGYDQKQGLRDLVERLREAIDGWGTRSSQEHILQIMKCLIHTPGAQQSTSMVVRGSTFQMLSAAFYYERRVRVKGDDTSFDEGHERFKQIMREELMAKLEFMRDGMIQWLETFDGEWDALNEDSGETVEMPEKRPH